MEASGQETVALSPLELRPVEFSLQDERARPGRVFSLASGAAKVPNRPSSEGLRENA